MPATLTLKHLRALPDTELDNYLSVAGHSVLASKQEAQAEYERNQQTIVAPQDYPVPTLRGASRELWDSTDSECILAGPAETGKTFAACHKLNMLMWKYPGAQAAIIRKLHTTMNGTVLQTFRRVLGKDSVVKVYGGERPEFYEYPNGSRVWVGGMDNPQKALSSERDAVLVNQAEELDLADWEILSTRTTGRGAVMPFTLLFGDCNPGPATHWILNRPSLHVLYSHHEDNPTLFDDEGRLTDQGKRTMTALDNLTGVRKKRLRYGLWAGAEGMVYEEWSRQTHVLSFEQLVEAGIFAADGSLNSANVRDVVGAVDWGYTNPGVIQVWVTDSDGRAYMVHEVYLTGKLIEWWVPKAVELKKRYGIRRFHCDPAEPAYIEAFNKASLNAIGADNDIAPGIQVVQARLKCKEDGRPRFHVYNAALEARDPALDEAHKPCGLIEEMDGYIWPKSTDQRPNKEVPVDKDNHAEDTARYAMMGLQTAGVRKAVVGKPRPPIQQAGYR